jgi:alkylated DNA repair protein (DNA oxidative demethylase)
MTADLFADQLLPALPDEVLGEGAIVLRGFAKDIEPALLCAVDDVIAQAPLRHMITPGGFRMSVAMTNCGPLGWVSSRSGYRYDPVDPESGSRWPGMPSVFTSLARRAASAAGFDHFEPDACLINRYAPETKLSLHQDRDEHDKHSPIVSVSLGLPAIFLWGGNARSDKTRKISLEHGDVVVWGGPSRFDFHGIAPLAAGQHATLGAQRINITFRRAR